MHDESVQRESALNRAFSSGSIWTAGESELLDYLKTLNTEGIPNDMVRHRAIVRALTINHIQTARLLDALEKRSQKQQRLFLLLAIGTLVITAAGVAVAI